MALQRRLLAQAADAVRAPLEQQQLGGHDEGQHKGGCLVYATCSVLEAENEAVARWFEELPGHTERWEPFPFVFSHDESNGQNDTKENDGNEAPFELDDFHADRRYAPVSRDDDANRHLPGHFLATLPHIHGCDGFFIARWRRI